MSAAAAIKMFFFIFVSFKKNYCCVHGNIRLPNGQSTRRVRVIVGSEDTNYNRSERSRSHNGGLLDTSSVEFAAA